MTDKFFDTFVEPTPSNLNASTEQLIHSGATHLAQRMLVAEAKKQGMSTQEANARYGNITDSIDAFQGRLVEEYGDIILLRRYFDDDLPPEAKEFGEVLVRAMVETGHKDAGIKGINFGQTRDYQKRISEIEKLVQEATNNKSKLAELQAQVQSAHYHPAFKTEWKASGKRNLILDMPSALSYNEAHAGDTNAQIKHKSRVAVGEMKNTAGKNVKHIVGKARPQTEAYVDQYEGDAVVITSGPKGHFSAMYDPDDFTTIAEAQETLRNDPRLWDLAKEQIELLVQAAQGKAPDEYIVKYEEGKTKERVKAAIAEARQNLQAAAPHVQPKAQAIFQAMRGRNVTNIKPQTYAQSIQDINNLANTQVVQNLRNVGRQYEFKAHQWGEWDDTNLDFAQKLKFVEQELGKRNIPVNITTLEDGTHRISLREDGREIVSYDIQKGDYDVIQSRSGQLVTGKILPDQGYGYNTDYEEFAKALILGYRKAKHTADPYKKRSMAYTAISGALTSGSEEFDIKYTHATAGAGRALKAAWANMFRMGKRTDIHGNSRTPSAADLPPNLLDQVWNRGGAGSPYFHRSVLEKLQGAFSDDKYAALKIKDQGRAPLRGMNVSTQQTKESSLPPIHRLAVIRNDTMMGGGVMAPHIGRMKTVKKFVKPLTELKPEDLKSALIPGAPAKTVKSVPLLRIAKRSSKTGQLEMKTIQTPAGEIEVPDFRTVNMDLNDNWERATDPQVTLNLPATFSENLPAMADDLHEYIQSITAARTAFNESLPGDDNKLLQEQAKYAQEYMQEMGIPLHKARTEGDLKIHRGGFATRLGTEVGLEAKVTLEGDSLPKIAGHGTKALLARDDYTLDQFQGTDIIIGETEVKDRSALNLNRAVTMARLGDQWASAATKAPQSDFTEILTQGLIGDREFKKTEDLQNFAEQKKEEAKRAIESWKKGDESQYIWNRDLFQAMNNIVEKYFTRQQERTFWVEEGQEFPYTPAAEQLEERFKAQGIDKRIAIPGVVKMDHARSMNREGYDVTITRPVEETPLSTNFREEAAFTQVRVGPQELVNMKRFNPELHDYIMTEFGNEHMQEHIEPWLALQGKEKFDAMYSSLLPNSRRPSTIDLKDLLNDEQVTELATETDAFTLLDKMEELGIGNQLLETPEGIILPRATHMKKLGYRDIWGDKQSAILETYRNAILSRGTDTDAIERFKKLTIGTKDVPGQLSGAGYSKTARSVPVLGTGGTITTADGIPIGYQVWGHKRIEKFTTDLNARLKKQHGESIRQVSVQEVKELIKNNEGLHGFFVRNPDTMGTQTRNITRVITPEMAIAMSGGRVQVGETEYSLNPREIERDMSDTDADIGHTPIIDQIKLENGQLVLNDKRRAANQKAWEDRVKDFYAGHAREASRHSEMDDLIHITRKFFKDEGLTPNQINQQIEQLTPILDTFAGSETAANIANRAKTGSRDYTFQNLDPETQAANTRQTITSKAAMGSVFNVFNRATTEVAHRMQNPDMQRLAESAMVFYQMAVDKTGLSQGAKRLVDLSSKLYMHSGGWAESTERTDWHSTPHSLEHPQPGGNYKNISKSSAAEFADIAVHASELPAAEMAAFLATDDKQRARITELIKQGREGQDTRTALAKALQGSAGGAYLWESQAVLPSMIRAQSAYRSYDKMLKGHARPEEAEYIIQLLESGKFKKDMGIGRMLAAAQNASSGKTNMSTALHAQGLLNLVEQEGATTMDEIGDWFADYTIAVKQGLQQKGSLPSFQEGTKLGTVEESIPPGPERDVSKRLATKEDFVVQVSGKEAILSEQQVEQFTKQSKAAREILQTVGHMLPRFQTGTTAMQAFMGIETEERHEYLESPGSLEGDTPQAPPPADSTPPPQVTTIGATNIDADNFNHMVSNIATAMQSMQSLTQAFGKKYGLDNAPVDRERLNELETLRWGEELGTMFAGRDEAADIYGQLQQGSPVHLSTAQIKRLKTYGKHARNIAEKYHASPTERARIWKALGGEVETDATGLNTIKEGSTLTGDIDADALGEMLAHAAEIEPTLTQGVERGDIIGISKPELAIKQAQWKQAASALAMNPAALKEAETLFKASEHQDTARALAQTMWESGRGEIKQGQAFRNIPGIGKVPTRNLAEFQQALPGLLSEKVTNAMEATPTLNAKEMTEMGLLRENLLATANTLKGFRQDFEKVDKAMEVLGQETGETSKNLRLTREQTNRYKMHTALAGNVRSLLQSTDPTERNLGRKIYDEYFGDEYTPTEDAIAQLTGIEERGGQFDTERNAGRVETERPSAKMATQQLIRSLTYETFMPWGLPRQLMTMGYQPAQQWMAAYTGSMFNAQQGAYGMGVSAMGGAPADFLSTQAKLQQAQTNLGQQAYTAWGWAPRLGADILNKQGALTAIGLPALGIGGGAAMMANPVLQYLGKRGVISSPGLATVGIAATAAAATYGIGSQQYYKEAGQKEYERALTAAGKESPTGEAGAMEAYWQEQTGLTKFAANIPIISGVTKPIAHHLLKHLAPKEYQTILEQGDKTLGNVTNIANRPGFVANILQYQATKGRLAQELPNYNAEQISQAAQAYFALTGETDLAKYDTALLRGMSEQALMTGVSAPQRIQQYQSLGARMGATSTTSAAEYMNKWFMGEPSTKRRKIEEQVQIPNSKAGDGRYVGYYYDQPPAYITETRSRWESYQVYDDPLDSRTQSFITETKSRISEKFLQSLGTSLEEGIDTIRREWGDNFEDLELLSTEDPQRYRQEMGVINRDPRALAAAGIAPLYETGGNIMQRGLPIGTTAMPGFFGSLTPMVDTARYHTPQTTAPTQYLERPQEWAAGGTRGISLGLATIQREQLDMQNYQRDLQLAQLGGYTRENPDGRASTWQRGLLDVQDDLTRAQHRYEQRQWEWEKEEIRPLNNRMQDLQYEQGITNLEQQQGLYFGDTGLTNPYGRSRDFTWQVGDVSAISRFLPAGFQQSGSGLIDYNLMQQRLQWGQQAWQFQWQQDNFDLQNDQWYERWNNQGDRLQQQREWLNEDMNPDNEDSFWARRRAVQLEMENLNYTHSSWQRNTQYGWQMEDYDEAIRFATGRQKRQLERRKDRATIMHGAQSGYAEQMHDLRQRLLQIEEDQHEEQYDRAQERLQWQVEDHEMAQRHHEQDREMQQERMDVNRALYDALHEAEVDLAELKADNMREDMEMQRERLEIQRELYDAVRESREELDALKDTIMGLKEEAHTIWEDFNELFNEFKTDMLELQNQWSTEQWELGVSYSQQYNQNIQDLNTSFNWAIQMGLFEDWTSAIEELTGAGRQSDITTPAPTYGPEPLPLLPTVPNPNDIAAPGGEYCPTPTYGPEPLPLPGDTYWGMARGGYVSQPTYALIGEAGPEYVVPAGGTLVQRDDRVVSVLERIANLLSNSDNTARIVVNIEGQDAQENADAVSYILEGHGISDIDMANAY